jgi:hypothetical protein
VWGEELGVLGRLRDLAGQGAHRGAGMADAVAMLTYNQHLTPST